MTTEPAPTTLRALIRESQTIAVLGAHTERARAAFYVPSYMAGYGHRVFAVNPAIAGRPYFAGPAVASLAELTEPVDMVLVFRRSTWLMQHVPEILAMSPRPKVVWFQLGIRHELAA
ncbi:MAG: CoA-binding protein, partial [Myxococcales bacterium]|nr:CoA-binding protein [Myxococcales bacterium]